MLSRQSRRELLWYDLLSNSIREAMTPSYVISVAFLVLTYAYFISLHMRIKDLVNTAHSEGPYKGTGHSGSTSEKGLKVNCFADVSGTTGDHIPFESAFPAP